MTEHVLPYDRAIVPQETGFWCGPASAQVVLNGLGLKVPEAQLAREVGTHTGGTDHIGLIERVLDQKVPDYQYTSVYTPNDPMSQAQKDRFWQHLVQSIVGNRAGVVANIVAPPNNPPRGTKGSTPPPYSRAVTTWHYVSIMGIDDDPASRAVWIADSANFGGITGFWCPFDGPGSICSLIPPKGYCYAARPVTQTVPAPVPAPPKAPALTKADSYALAIIGEGKRRGITERGIVIALSTALVESNLRMYANAKVPESMSLPHDAVGSDAYSVGLFQQQVVRGANGWWWGDARTCMEPALSAGLFYERLVRFDYNSRERSPGWFAAEIQRPAAQYRDRYDQRMPEAQRIYDRLAGTPTAQPDDEWEHLMTLKVRSKSIYAPPNEDPIPLSEMIAAFDAHGDHHGWIETLAAEGDPESLRLIALAAAGKQQYGNAPFAVNHAIHKLAEIKGVTVDEIRNQLKGTAA